jgi:hypothetical protein
MYVHLHAYIYEALYVYVCTCMHAPRSPCHTDYGQQRSTLEEEGREEGRNVKVKKRIEEGSHEF